MSQDSDRSDFVLERGWIRWLGMTLRRMMYDFKKWQYNSAEKQAVMEEAMKATRNLMLPMRSSYFRFLVLWLNKVLRKLPVEMYVSKSASCKMVEMLSFQLGRTGAAAGLRIDRDAAGTEMCSIRGAATYLVVERF